MIVLGSVARDGDGYLVEAKFHTAAGKIIFSEIGRARSARGIDGAVRDIANNVIERPARRHGDRRRGRALPHQHRQELAHRPRHDFTLTTPTFGEGSKVAGYRRPAAWR